MNTKVRMTLQAMRNPMKNDKELENVERQGNRLMVLEKSTRSQRRSSREKKMALIQDVDKLKRKLRHEENVHRALERAFTRPLGALPRLPPYLPPYTLELLAEVAVLEEEVVRLEEQVVNFRQGLYEEAVYISSSKKNMDNLTDSCNTSIRNPMIDGPKSLSQVDIASETLAQEPISDQVENCSDQPTIVKQSPKKAKSNSPTSYDGRGKENQSCSNSSKQNKQSPKQSFPNVRTPVKKPMEKHLDPLKHECRTVNDSIIEGNCLANPCERLAGGECSSPNKVSEDILKCLISIFLRMSTRKSRVIELMLSSSSGLPSSGIDEENESQDPYGTCKEFGMRDIGPYKHLCTIEAKFMNSNRTANSLFLIQRLRILKGKLGSVDLQGLTHHQKLAFWINIYNSCMMNAFLDHGIPETPQMVITLMQTATINVSGHMLNAMTIEHFILRLPHHSKYPLLSPQQTSAKGAKNEEMTARSVFALDFSEPLVTFALSCGSWSSPTVRVYTASDVENELEAAKREYLQAAIGISTEDKIVIPKLLDWYLHDFAKDLDSFLDWLFLQLPTELRKELMNCVERGNRKHLLQSIEVMPYDFSFRLLLQQ